MPLPLLVVLLSRHSKIRIFLHFFSIKSFVEVHLSFTPCFSSLSLRFIYHCTTLTLFFFILGSLHSRFPIVTVTHLGRSHCDRGDLLSHSHSHSRSLSFFVSFFLSLPLPGSSLMAILALKLLVSLLALVVAIAPSLRFLSCDNFGFGIFWMILGFSCVNNQSLFLQYRLWLWTIALNPPFFSTTRYTLILQP